MSSFYMSAVNLDSGILPMESSAQPLPIFIYNSEVISVHIEVAR